MRSLGRRLLVAAAVAATAGLVASIALFAYFAAHPAPKRFALDSSGSPAAAPTPSPAATELGCGSPPPLAQAETWLVKAGSQAGYRVQERFAELSSPHEAVARTQGVDGYVLLLRPPGQVPVLAAACVAADGRTLRSIDELPAPLPPAARRDGHYGNMLDLLSHPYLTFRTSDFTLPAKTFSGETFDVTLPGRLEMRGNVRPAIARAQARVAGGEAELAGSLVAHVPDWGVEVPGDPVVSPDVTIEFLLRLARG
jgi:hypothetical protein